MTGTTARKARTRLVVGADRAVRERRGRVDPDQSRELPVHQPVSETLYRSEDQQRRDRAADTGPVTYFPPEHL